MEVFMSALGLDDFDDPRGARAYAPRRRHAEDDTTIRPVLERLRRAEGRVPPPRLMRKEPVQDMPAPDVEMVAKSAFPMTARFALAAGVLALIGAAATAGYLVPSANEHPAPAATSTPTSTALPKPVQTLSIQRPSNAEAQSATRVIKDDARMPQQSAAAIATAGASAAAKQPLHAASDPSTDPLEAWAAMPTGAAASGWSPPAQAAPDRATPAPPEISTQSADAASKPEAGDAVQTSAIAHRARHVARHRSAHHRRQRNARAQALPQAAQTAQPVETEPTQTQAVKKLPLQAAIDRIFGTGTNGSGSAPPPQQ
jgi:hypothetical protein